DHQSGHQHRDLDHPCRRLPACRERPRRSNRGATMTAPLWHIAAWPLVVKVPVLVAGLMVTVAATTSQVVLWRFAQGQESNLRSDHQSGHQHRDLDHPCRRLPACRERPRRSNRGATMTAPLWHIAAWPLVVKVPVLVAGLMVTVAATTSQVVLWRFAQDQESNL